METRNIMNNKEALTEDISNIMYGDSDAVKEGTSIEPNDRVVKELEGLVKLNAVGFAEWYDKVVRLYINMERYAEFNPTHMDNGKLKSAEQLYELWEQK